MNCIACKIEISPNFIAAIKDNRCPACGQKCLADAEYGALFDVVNSILSVSPDLGEDAIIKIATAMHGKFDIFPKGVVVDGYATKEVIYVSAAPAGRTNYGNAYPAHQQPQAYDMHQDIGSNIRNAAPPARLSPQQQNKVRTTLADVIDEMDQDDGDDTVRFSSDDEIRQMEAERLAKQKLDRIRAQKAGIKP